jgi:hypothetical protein
MLMASSPSRITGLAATRAGDGSVEAKWNAAAERGVTSYRVRWEDADGKVGGVRAVKGTTARMAGVPSGATVEVRAIGAGGLEGWDWARARPTD